MTDAQLTLYIVSSVAIMFVFAMGIILFFNLSQKKIQAETLKNQELKISFQKQLLEKTITTQEEERNRIAIELHDDIGSKLNVIHLSLHSLKGDIKKEKDVAELLDDIEVSLQKSIERTRQISHELVPPTLRKFGVLSAIEDLQGAVNRTNTVDFVVHQYTEWNLEDEMAQLHVYRMIQELVQNGLKHAKAEQLAVSFEQKENVLEIIYQDDGIGMPKDMESRGLGMTNLETRVQLLQGDWQIDREVEKGTQIKIKIPV